MLGATTGACEVASSGLVPGGLVRFSSGNPSGRSPAPGGSKHFRAGAEVSPNLAVSSVLGRSFHETPLVVPLRGHLGSVRRFMKGDYYIGRRCRQRSFGCSLFANPFKVAKCGRDRAIELFAKHLDDDASLRSSFWILSGLRLLCHCGPLQSCHADALTTAFVHDFPSAYDRHDTTASVPPTSAQSNYLAELREEPASSGGSSADEEAAAAGAGWTGTGKPMQIGVGYTVRDCDGQSLASPGRWPPAMRRYPSSDTWIAATELVRRFSEHYGTTQLLILLGAWLALPFLGGGWPFLSWSEVGPCFLGLGLAFSVCGLAHPFCSLLLLFMFHCFFTSWFLFFFYSMADAAAADPVFRNRCRNSLRQR